MVIKKIYEDVLDDIDEIKPDVPEEPEEREDKRPVFMDGYACTVLISGPHSLNKDIGRNVIPDVLRVYLDKYCDDYRMTFISSGKELYKFTEKRGRVDIDDDDVWPHTVVQFNASPRNALRLIFWIFSVGMYFMRFVRSGKKWRTYTHANISEVYELVRGTHMEIKDRYLNYVVDLMTGFAGDEKCFFPDSETLDYARKIVETYNKMFGKRQSGQGRPRTSPRRSSIYA